MNIQGLQKLTLLDFPKHVACTIFTGGCQLNCPFCHNSELITGAFDKGISSEEILSFLKKRKGILDGVCITGGEPLVHNDIEDFIKKIRALGYMVKLDSNGGYPDKLKHLIESNLVDYVAMDIKNTPEKYGMTVGVEELNMAPFIKSKELLMEGHIDYEFRTTIVKEFHTFEDILGIAEFIKGAHRYYLQSFVDREQVRDHSLTAYDKNELEQILQKVKEIIPCAELRGV